MDTKIAELVKRKGEVAQILQLADESAEMTKMCTDLLKGKEISRERLVDSLADMYVMLQTMCGMYVVTEEEITAVIDKKLDKALEEARKLPVEE